MSDVVERAKAVLEHQDTCIGHGLVRDLAAEVERLHALIQRGLAYGDQFRTSYAAGARAELRQAAGMTAPRQAEL